MIYACAKTFLGQHAACDVVPQLDAGGQYKANLLEQSVAYRGDPRRRVVATGRAPSLDGALADLLGRCCRLVDHHVARSGGFDFPDYGKLAHSAGIPARWAGGGLEHCGGDDDGDSDVSFEEIGGGDDGEAVDTPPESDKGVALRVEARPPRVTSPEEEEQEVVEVEDGASAPAVAQPLFKPTYRCVVPYTRAERPRPQSTPVVGTSDAGTDLTPTATATSPAPPASPESPRQQQQQHHITLNTAPPAPVYSAKYQHSPATNTTTTAAAAASSKPKSGTTTVPATAIRRRSPWDDPRGVVPPPPSTQATQPIFFQQQQQQRQKKQQTQEETVEMEVYRRWKLLMAAAAAERRGGHAAAPRPHFLAGWPAFDDSRYVRRARHALLGGYDGLSAQIPPAKACACEGGQQQQQHHHHH
ncbi:hypothetical protein N3K66_008285 [Trichothecium roseum]|uniref:Uncharacterized protein n=1 Tax=Trichothecium roseum TaxID=47278 RepID=A0ACC0UTE3_9HYPO|nr:hypothetical protein N3K66_008285 [Trichothecium roseum]